MFSILGFKGLISYEKCLKNELTSYNDSIFNDTDLQNDANTAYDLLLSSLSSSSISSSSATSLSSFSSHSSLIKAFLSETSYANLNAIIEANFTSCDLYGEITKVSLLVWLVGLYFDLLFAFSSTSSPA